MKIPRNRPPEYNRLDGWRKAMWNSPLDWPCGFLVKNFAHFLLLPFPIYLCIIIIHIFISLTTISPFLTYTTPPPPPPPPPHHHTTHTLSTITKTAIPTELLVVVWPKRKQKPVLLIFRRIYTFVSAGESLLRRLPRLRAAAAVSTTLYSSLFIC